MTAWRNREEQVRKALHSMPGSERVRAQVQPFLMFASHCKGTSQQSTAISTCLPSLSGSTLRPLSLEIDQQLQIATSHSAVYLVADEHSCSVFSPLLAACHPFGG